MVSKFMGIYNKRRTRTIEVRKEETIQVETTPKWEVEPKETYVEDPLGDYIRTTESGYLPKSYGAYDYYHILGSDGRYWNLRVSQPSINSLTVYFRKDITPGIEYKGEKQYKPTVSIITTSSTARDTNIVGTATAFSLSLWELLICSPLPWTWFRGLVTDGYYMIFLSPIILIY